MCLLLERFSHNHRPPSNLDLADFDPSVVSTAGDSTLPVEDDQCHANINDMFYSSGLPISKPLSEPTISTFLILRRSFATIMGRIVHHFQKLDEPAQYSDVERLQSEIETYVQSLPPHFRMHDPDKSLDQSESLLRRALSLN